MEMIIDDDIIDVSLYGGRNLFSKAKKDQNPYSVRILKCNSKNDCPLYKAGNCMAIMSGMGSICTEGRVQVIRGTNYGTKKWGELTIYRDHPKYDALKRPTNCMFFVVGDKFYLDIGHGVLTDTGDGIKFEDPMLFSSENSDIFPLTYLSPKLINDINNFRPRAIMGGIIESYSKEKLPHIMEGIRKYAPDEFSKFLITTDDKSRERWSSSIIGRTAYLNSLKSGCIVIYNGWKFKVFGDFMESYDVRIPNMPFGANEMKVSIRVTPEMVYVIDSMEQVDKKIRYVEENEN